jgi:Copper amine oxidase, enzyme domain
MNNFKKFVSIGAVTMMLSSMIFAGETEAKRTKRADQPLDIKITATGPTQTDVDAAKVRVERSAPVVNALKGAKYRLINFEYIESATQSMPQRFRVYFYNYSTDKTVIAESNFAGTEEVSVREESFDPGVSNEEISAAYEMIKADTKLGELYKQNNLDIYEAMPPVSNVKGERLVNVGFMNKISGENQIVGISFKNDKIIYYQGNAPETARAQGVNCGIPSAGQGSTANGTAGQYALTVSQSGSPLWEMTIVRPSASSGASSERSGIEVQNVKYKGKTVLKRGHAPVLNVQYINNACGPFRDWQYAEGFFNAPDAGATDPAAGIRILGTGQIATTSVESGSDTGNYKGVAVYQQDVGNGNELVMVSEMNAGWYRYVMEWRFAPDGTIRPRYGFGSTVNSCVCAPRNHHVYWRFDFDIVQPNNKIFQVERGRKFQQPLSTEAAVFRNYKTNRSLLIQNSNGDEAYQITPSITDGTVTDDFGVLNDTYGAGDLWVMRFQGTATAPGELDDPNSGSAVNLAPWINSESLVNQDLVVWYGAHEYRPDGTSLTNFSRSNSNQVLTGVHVIGPTLKPVRW